MPRNNSEEPISIEKAREFKINQSLDVKEKLYQYVLALNEEVLTLMKERNDSALVSTEKRLLLLQNSLFIKSPDEIDARLREIIKEIEPYRHHPDV